MPKVSVIIPNYNHEAFLERRIKSVLNQTFQDFELILLDDCSTDNSKKIIESYRGHEKVTHIVYNEKNSGSPYKQWAKGIALASGEWIWIAESDDDSKSQFLEQLAPVFDTTDCTLAYSEVCLMNDEGKLLIPVKHLHQKWWEGAEFLERKMMSGNYLCNAGMVVFRRSAAKQYILEEFLKYKIGGDWFFWMHIAAQGKVYACGKPLAFFIKHSTEFSNQFAGKAIWFDEQIRVLISAEQKSFISRKALRKTVKDNVVSLYCVRSGVEKKLFSEMVELWMNVSKQYGFGLKPALLKLKAQKNKLVHFAGQKIQQTRIA